MSTKQNQINTKKRLNAQQFQIVGIDDNTSGDVIMTVMHRATGIWYDRKSKIAFVHV
jgi:hypothetical protein